MDKKDMIAFFQELRMFYGENAQNKMEKLADLDLIFQDYNIRKLDIKRIYRYLDKNVKADTEVVGDDDDDLDDE